MIDYYQVVEPFSYEIVIKKSRFITTLIPIRNAEEAEAELAIINKKYSDATHNCYAYISNIIATEQRFSDNGEPQGTAGIPMLEVLKKRKIYLTLAVVTRYFGGIKLGASGLVRAYSDSVVQALEHANVKRFIMSDVGAFVTSYNLYPKAVEYIEKYNGKVESVDYGENVTIKFAIPTDYTSDLEAKLVDFSAGKINIIYSEKDYIAYEI